METPYIAVDQAKLNNSFCIDILRTPNVKQSRIVS